MSEPYLGEIRIFGFNFAPRGWARCEGQLLPIDQNQSLYAILGTTYGGDGRTTFGLPDLRGRAPLHRGGSFASLGGKTGAERTSLTEQQIPEHTHVLQASSDNGTTAAVPGNVLARATTNVYAAPGALGPLAPEAVGPGGGGQAHENMQPFLAVTFCIALTGLFPPRN